MAEVTITLSTPKQVGNDAVKVTIERIIFERGELEVGLRFFDATDTDITFQVMKFTPAEYSSLLQANVSAGVSLGQAVRVGIKTLVKQRYELEE